MDDFVEVSCTWPNHFLTTQGQTFEVVFTTLNNGQNQWFISQTNGLAIGLNEIGTPILKIGDEIVSAEIEALDNGECHQLSVVIVGSQVDWYIDGNHVSSTNTIVSLIFDHFKSFYLGTDINTNSFFQGVIEDTRLFADERSYNEILNNLFFPLNSNENNLAFYMSLNNNPNLYLTVDPFYTHMIGYLGGTTNVVSQRPNWIHETCMQEESEPESIGGICSSYSPTLIMPAPNELVINGDFEQYCAGLSTAISNKPEEAFINFNQNGGQSVVQSDVANWEVANYSTGSDPIGSSDFYVRNGIGGIPPAYPYATTPSTQSWFINPPSNTWNNNGNAFAGFCGYNDVPNYVNEGLIKTLKQNLLPNQSYVFSAWVYVPGVNLLTGPSYDDSYLQVSISNGTTRLVVVPYIKALEQSLITTNGGWQKVSVTFVTPSVLAGYNILDIRNATGLAGLLEAQGDSYMFIDDVSLKEVALPIFPSYIGTSQLPDGFKCQIKVDANDDVIVMGQVQNNPLSTSYQPSNQSSSANATEGFFIAKYSEDGALLWQKLFPFLTCNGFDVDANNDIYCVGGIEPYVTSNNLPSMVTQTNFHWPVVICSDSYGSANMFIQKLNGSTGVEIMLNGYGGNGHEVAKDIVIEGNNAYIAVDMNTNIEVVPNNCIPPITYTTNSHQGSILWAGLPKNANLIIKANVGSGFTELNLPTSFNIDNSLSIGADNGNVYLLTINKLHTYSSNLTATNTPISVASQYYLHVADGKIYTLGAHSVTQRNANNLISNWTKTYGSSFWPKALTTKQTSNGHEVVVSLVNHANTNCNPVCDQLLRIEKLASINGSITWSKESVHTNSVMTNYGIGYRELDIDCFSNNDKFAFLAGFQPKTTGNWNIQLDLKNLSGTGNGQPTPDQNFIVSTIEDLGATGQFKRNIEESEVEEALIYPNPFKDAIHIKSSKIIKSVSVYDAMGRIILQINAKSMQIELDASTFKHGFYTVSIEFSNRTEVYKLVK